MTIIRVILILVQAGRIENKKTGFEFDCGL